MDVTRQELGRCVSGVEHQQQWMDGDQIEGLGFSVSRKDCLNSESKGQL